jgi:hypothetical protein
MALHLERDLPSRLCVRFHWSDFHENLYEALHIFAENFISSVGKGKKLESLYLKSNVPSRLLVSVHRRDLPENSNLEIIPPPAHSLQTAYFWWPSVNN